MPIGETRDAVLFGAGLVVQRERSVAEKDFKPGVEWGVLRQQRDEGWVMKNSDWMNS